MIPGEEPEGKRSFPRVAGLYRESISMKGGGVTYFSDIAMRETFRVSTLGYSPTRGPGICAVPCEPVEVDVEVHLVTIQRHADARIKDAWRPMAWTPLDEATMRVVITRLEGYPDPKPGEIW